MIIQSNILKKIEPIIKQIAQRIKQAVDDKQPILIRHHNDCDGYSSGVVLEHALRPLLYHRHDRERNVQYFINRIPSKSPYYDFQDALRDVSKFTRNHYQNGQKLPLIILTDLGSSEQSYDSIKLAKTYGANVIIIDHHPMSGKNKDLVDIFLNPHEIGSTYDFCAGMLCAEVAEQLYQNSNYHVFVAAVSGIADKVASKELDLYKKILPKDYTDDYMLHIAEVITYAAYYLPNEAQNIVDDLFGVNQKKQKQLIKLFGKRLKESKKYALNTAKQYYNIEDKGVFKFLTLDIESTLGNLEFPSSSKKLSLIHEMVNSKENKPVLSAGISSFRITFRCNNKLSFDVNEFIELVNKKLPYAQVTGGGHRVAGTIMFVPLAQKEILKILNEYIKNLKILK